MADLLVDPLAPGGDLAHRLAVAAGARDVAVEPHHLELQALEAQRSGVVVELAGTDDERRDQPRERVVAGRQRLARTVEVPGQVTRGATREVGGEEALDVERLQLAPPRRRDGEAAGEERALCRLITVPDVLGARRRRRRAG